MRIEHYPIDVLKCEIAAIVGRRLDLTRYRLFFFGSRVSGTSTERSDIDVGIGGPAEIPVEVIGAIREDLEELPTLYSIDVVDFAAASSDFTSVALQHTESIT